MMSLLSDAFNDEEVQSIPRKLKSDPALYFRHPNFEDDTNAEGVSKQEILRYSSIFNY